MRAYLELARPANTVTALADVLAGYAIAGRGDAGTLPWLLASTACLYAGGVVLNDFFDRRLDAVERPERPIPSGRVPARRAAWLGAMLLVSGVLAARLAGPAAGLVAGGVAVLVLFYDALAKKSAVFGPPAMGACRGLNLVLGMTTATAPLGGLPAVGLLPLAYIWSVTALSRGEVRGIRRSTSALALAGVLGVLAVLSFLSLQTAGSSVVAALSLLFVLLLAVRVLPPFWRAYQRNDPAAVRRAVKAGVLSLVVLDACLTAIYAGGAYGLLILTLSILAAGLSRLFAVT